MPEFKDREEYEKWKAGRIKETREKNRAPDDQPSSGDEASPGGGTDKEGPEAPPLTADFELKKERLSGVGDLFKASWEIYKKRACTIFSIYLISSILFGVIIGVFSLAGMIFSSATQTSRSAVLTASLITGITAGFIALIWGFAASIYAVADEGLGIKESLGKGWQRVGAFAWLFSVLGYMITGGFLLFFVPGFVFSVWFVFAQFILASEGEKGMNALLKSREYVRGHSFEVFARLVAVWLVSTLMGMVPFVGVFLSLSFVPFVLIFTYLMYEEVKSLKGGNVVYAASTGEKFKFIGMATLGYIVVPAIIIAVMGATVLMPLLMLKGLMHF